MSNCCDQPIRPSSHCITQVEPVLNPTVNISLPTIERAIDCAEVVLPCRYSHKALVAAQFCLSCLQFPGSLDPISSDIRQFSQCADDIGLVPMGCPGTIQVPELWVQALEESIDRNGENFSQIYLRKLSQNAAP